ncbi:MAG: LptF/LptG family permease [Candidatus Marinimicrobia bacterium]|nr:LptF/LptG family permease [Candidatus Neomarinimicrobiota bacterium]
MAAASLLYFRPQMHILDRYVLRRFLANFSMAMVAFLILFLVVDVVENLDQYIDAKMPRQAILAYYYYTLPWFISIGLPMATLLATFFSMGILHKQNEITAMKASGFSVRRIGASLLIAGLVISAGSFYLDDIFVTEGLRKKADIQSQYLARLYRKKHKVKKQNIYLQESRNEVLAIDRYDHRTETAHGVYLQRYEGGRMVARVDFPKLKWDAESQAWLGEKYTMRRFDNAGDAQPTVTHGFDTLLTLTLNPLDLTRMSVTPEEMRYGELRDFVAGLKRNGIDPTRWAVNMHFKVAFAATSFIMVLFGLPLSIGRPRSSLAVGAGMSIMVIFGYYVAIKLGQSFGIKGVLPPMASVWLPNLIFMGMGFYLLAKLRS